MVTVGYSSRKLAGGKMVDVGKSGSSQRLVHDLPTARRQNLYPSAPTVLREHRSIRKFHVHARYIQYLTFLSLTIADVGRFIPILQESEDACKFGAGKCTSTRRQQVWCWPLASFCLDIGNLGLAIGQMATCHWRLHLSIRKARTSHRRDAY